MENLETLKNNGFKISKIGTKHANQFKYNVVTRPLTLSCALQMLTNHSECSLKDFAKLTTGVSKWATDFYNNNKSDAKIEIRFGKYAELIFGKGISKRSISLQDSFFNDFDFLADEKIYKTNYEV